MNGTKDCADSTVIYQQIIEKYDISVIPLMIQWRYYKKGWN